jgi:hypothetical protein
MVALPLLCGPTAYGDAVEIINSVGGILTSIVNAAKAPAETTVETTAETETPVVATQIKKTEYAQKINELKIRVELVAAEATHKMASIYLQTVLTNLGEASGIIERTDTELIIHARALCSKLQVAYLYLKAIVGSSVLAMTVLDLDILIMDITSFLTTLYGISCPQPPTTSPATIDLAIDSGSSVISSSSTTTTTSAAGTIRRR